MPSLRQLKCTVEVGPKNIVLKEYGTKIGDGYVESFIAVPSQHVPFNIHLTSSGYIAPGLAMFVFIDGVAQCNRNRRGLIIPDKTTEPWQTEVEFRVRQKEDKFDDGRWIGREWTFAQLNTVTADAVPKVKHNILSNIGTIDVVVLRCQDNPNSEGSYVLSEKKTTCGKEKNSNTANKNQSKAGSVAMDNVAFGLLDGACDEKPKKPANAFALDGGWDDDDDVNITFQWPPSPANLDGPADRSGRFQRGPSQYPQGPLQPTYSMPVGPTPPFPQSAQYPPPQLWQQPWMAGGYQPYVPPYAPQWTGQAWPTAPPPPAVPQPSQQWAPMWPDSFSSKAEPTQPQQENHQDARHKSPWQTASGVYRNGNAEIHSQKGSKASSARGWSNNGSKKENQSEQAAGGKTGNNWDVQGTLDAWASTGGTGDVQDTAPVDAWANIGDAWGDAKDTTRSVAGGNASGTRSVKMEDPSPPEVSWSAAENDSKSRKVKSGKNKKVATAGDTLVDPERPYIKAYWSGVSRASKSDSANDKKKISKGLYLVPEEPLIPVPSKVAVEKHMSHQVQAGKGAIYYHRTARPKYIDTMKRPYAVFSFKYRSKEMLQKLLDIEIKEDKQDYRQRMRELTKEEVIEQLMKAKTAAGYSENSSLSSGDGDEEEHEGTNQGKPKSSKAGGWQEETKKGDGGAATPW